MSCPRCKSSFLKVDIVIETIKDYKKCSNKNCEFQTYYRNNIFKAKYYPSRTSDKYIYLVEWYDYKTIFYFKEFDSNFLHGITFGVMPYDMDINKYQKTISLLK